MQPSAAASISMSGAGENALSSAISSAAPQYRQLARVGGLTRAHALHGTSSDEAKARGLGASAVVLPPIGSSIATNEILAAIIHVDFAWISPT